VPDLLQPAKSLGIRIFDKHKAREAINKLDEKLSKKLDQLIKLLQPSPGKSFIAFHPLLILLGI